MFYFPLLGEMYELVINIYISLLYISSSIKYLIKKMASKKKFHLNLDAY